MKCKNVEKYLAKHFLYILVTSAFQLNFLKEGNVKDPYVILHVNVMPGTNPKNLSEKIFPNSDYL